uniref:Uncharacterized protein n=1 Tax=Solanum lycopersicum TaxID=4081 RepID=A0A494G8C5_SOLLC
MSIFSDKIEDTIEQPTDESRSLMLADNVYIHVLSAYKLWRKYSSKKQTRKIFLLIRKEVHKQIGCQYTGVTLSEWQLEYAKLRVERADLQVVLSFIVLFIATRKDLEEATKVVQEKMIVCRIEACRGVWTKVQEGALESSVI